MVSIIGSCSHCKGFTLLLASNKATCRTDIVSHSILYVIPPWHLHEMKSDLIHRTKHTNLHTNTLVLQIGLLACATVPLQLEFQCAWEAWYIKTCRVICSIDFLHVDCLTSWPWYHKSHSIRPIPCSVGDLEFCLFSSQHVVLRWFYFIYLKKQCYILPTTLMSEVAPELSPPGLCRLCWVAVTHSCGLSGPGLGRAESVVMTNSRVVLYKLSVCLP